MPQKLCAHCERTMTWRKKWAKNWEDVKYCSDACRRQSHSEPARKALSND
ncbi:MAG: DUF2256 domain-containing protein [Burkholderiaceae bacterium]